VTDNSNKKLPTKIPTGKNGLRERPTSIPTTKARTVGLQRAES
jgi:hypothetical protein